MAHARQAPERVHQKAERTRTANRVLTTPPQRTPSPLTPFPLTPFPTTPFPTTHAHTPKEQNYRPIPRPLHPPAKADSVLP